MKESDIDFVILWVDGNDPAWQEERSRYQPGAHGDNRVQRFRDWENLHYLFRGIDKFTPWVRKVHFVTWGHLPPWLNTNHPKLHIVNHRDFIPEKYLPTFNCNTIEMNLHRIEGLAEQFVYFNDDMFLISPAKPELFFRDGLPCGSACMNVPCYNNLVTGLTYDTAQAVCFVNKYFDMHQTLRKNWRKWFTPLYGKYLLRTLYLLPCPRFPGLWHSHMPTSLLKSTYRKVWELEEHVLDVSCMNKFREPLDYTQATLEFYQYASGNFYPRRADVGVRLLWETDQKDSKSMDALSRAAKTIQEQRHTFVALYDTDYTEEEFESQKRVLNAAFQSILPESSMYENLVTSLPAPPPKISLVSLSAVCLLTARRNARGTGKAVA